MSECRVSVHRECSLCGACAFCSIRQDQFALLRCSEVSTLGGATCSSMHYIFKAKSAKGKIMAFEEDNFLRSFFLSHAG